MEVNNLLGGVVALFSALTWGSGDFSGGLASRRNSPFQVLTLAAFSASLALGLAMFLRSEAIPDNASLFWSVCAGVSGAIGTALLYWALAIGQAAIVAPTAAVVSVALPVIIGTLTRGSPGLEKYLGILAALAGIWLVARRTEAIRGNAGFGLSVLAGFGFSGYFLCIVRVAPGSLFGPLLLAKITAFVFSLLVLTFQRNGTSRLTFRGSSLPLLAGILDAVGNLFFLLAARLMRLELAVVISSMAPAMTVILAALLSHQKATNPQKLGVLLCLLAIALIIL